MYLIVSTNKSNSYDNVDKMIYEVLGVQGFVLNTISSGFFGARDLEFSGPMVEKEVIEYMQEVLREKTLDDTLKIYQSD